MKIPKTFPQAGSQQIAIHDLPKMKGLVVEAAPQGVVKEMGCKINKKQKSE